MTTTAALVAVVVLLSIGWLAAEIRWSAERAASATERAASARLDAEARTWAAEAAALRATQAAREEYARILDRALREGASAQIAALPHLRNEATDAIPGLVRRLTGDLGGSDGRVG